MSKVTLRLFAAAREAEGAGAVEYEADNLAGLLSQAKIDYGEQFSEILDISRIWVNGEPVEGDFAISNGDEVAVLPPVSGG